MICVQTYLTRPTAEGARIALEARGVEVLIQADDLGGMRPELSLQKGVKLLVAEADVEMAKRILAECEREVENSSSDEDIQNTAGFLTMLRRWLKGSE